MADWAAKFREWLGVIHTPDAEKANVERIIREQHERLRTIDAGLPGRTERRHILLAQHPKRRLDDRP